MSVRKRTWRTSAGETHSVWFIQFTYRHPDGSITNVRRRAQTNTERAAKDEERELRAALLAGTYGKRTDVRTLRQLADEFLRLHRPRVKRSTMGYYRSKILGHVVPVLGDLPVTAVSSITVADFTAELFAKCSPGGVNSILRAFRALLGFAVEQGVLEKAPDVEMVEEPDPEEELQFVSADQTASFLAAVLHLEPEWHAFFVVAFRTGLRIAELIELRWKDVNLDRCELHVRRSRYDEDITTPKSGRSRIVPFPSEVAGTLRPLVSAPERLVFAYEDQTPFDRFIARAPIERVCRRIGMEPFNIHMTRHSYASHLVQRGVPLATVAKLLGQSVLTVTARYAHLGRSDLHDAVRVLEPDFFPRAASPATSRGTREAHAGSAEARSGRKVLQFPGRPSGLEPLTPGATVRCSTN